MLRKLTVFVAALALSLVAMLGAISVAPSGAQGAVRELLRQPVPQDECMCGGYTTLVLESRSYDQNQNRTYCTYGRYTNGTRTGTLINIYNGNYSCPA